MLGQPKRRARYKLNANLSFVIEKKTVDMKGDCTKKVDRDDVIENKETTKISVNHFHYIAHFAEFKFIVGTK